MKNIIFIFLFFIPQGILHSQTKSDSLINKAFINAQKGIYWCLSNIPENKYRLNHDLISGNNLIATVKLDIEINGIKVTATGYQNTAEVSIKIYKSIESLKKEGYLKNKDIKQPGEN